jgi:hypothetical protein
LVIVEKLKPRVILEINHFRYLGEKNSVKLLALISVRVNKQVFFYVTAYTLAENCESF